MKRKLLIWGDTPLAAWLAAALHPLHTVTWLVSHAVLAEYEAAGGLWVAGARAPLGGLRLATSYSAADQPELILLAAPAWATAQIMRDLQMALGWDASLPPVVSLQNGIGSIKLIESAWGEGANPLAAVVTRPFWSTRYLDGKPSCVYVATHPSGGIALQRDHPQAGSVAALLHQIGVQTSLGQADSILWSGVFWGIQANATAAVLDISPQEVYRDLALRAYEAVQLREALRVIDKLRVRLAPLPGVNVPRMAWQARSLPRLIGSLYLSRHPRPPELRDDLRFGVGRSDAAYFNGAVAVQAHDLQLRTPINHVLALLMTDIAEGRVLWSQYKGQKEMLFRAFRLAM